MAVNPLIALQAAAPDLTQTFSNVLLSLDRDEQLREQQRQETARAPLLAAQTAAAQAAVPTPQTQFNIAEQGRIKSVATAARQIIPDLQAGNIERVTANLQRRATALQEAGVSDADTQEAIQLAQTDPAELLRISQQAIQLDQQITPAGKVQFGGQQTFKDTQGNLFFGTTRRSPQTGQVETALAPIGKAPSQPIGQVRLVSGLGETAAEQRAAEIKITEEKELAKLKAQRKLTPEIKSAVATAVASAKLGVKQAGEARSNEVALNVYETAMNGLAESLGETTTGPVSGFLPAVSANQQIADGAVAAMAPVLKQLFRGAGEGTFTDKDQELLLEMVPTRKDLPKARVSKISNIDAIIRAKLGQSPVQQVTDQPAPSQVIKFDAQGNIIQ